MSNYYNLSEVIELAGGDDDFVKVIIETFLEEIPPDVRSMSEAIDNSNPTLAYQFAHKMKPNLQLFGLELMDQILAIEAWAKGTGNELKAKEAKEKIHTKVAKVEILLKEDFGL